MVKHGTQHTGDLWNGPSLNGGLLPLSCYVVMFSPLVPVWLCCRSWLRSIPGVHFVTQTEWNWQGSSGKQRILYCYKLTIRVPNHPNLNKKYNRKAKDEFCQVKFDRSGTACSPKNSKNCFARYFGAKQQISTQRSFNKSFETVKLSSSLETEGQFDHVQRHNTLFVCDSTVFMYEAAVENNAQSSSV